ncbi:hypothetical protein HD806DRAFT_518369 [Xylariaceae sp. AK1471]|nr:hypothetical protein HD806DRAFT_518369 [Xylariaceae sp. AK1471]
MENSSEARVLDDLIGVLGDAIVIPESEDAFENELKPGCIARPSGVTQVQSLITTLRPHILSGHCQVAIRGSGYTPFSKSANEQSVVEIGVGETWSTVALKCGLNNFGIVTLSKMKTFKLGNIWGGATYYTPGTFSQLLQKACEFVYNATDEDTHITCSVGYGLVNKLQYQASITIHADVSLMETFHDKWQETLETHPLHSTFY